MEVNSMHSGPGHQVHENPDSFGREFISCFVRRMKQTGILAASPSQHEISQRSYVLLRHLWCVKENGLRPDTIRVQLGCRASEYVIPVALFVKCGPEILARLRLTVCSSYCDRKFPSVQPCCLLVGLLISEPEWLPEVVSVYAVNRFPYMFISENGRCRK